MGIAGAEGFRSSLCGADVKDVGEDEAIDRMVRLCTMMLILDTMIISSSRI